MGCLLVQRRRNLLSFLLFLLILITSWTFVKGREFPNLVKVEEDNLVSTQMKKGKDNVEAVVIGSRPPRCERRCSSCNGPCLAIQVPIIPTKLTSHQQHQFNATTTLAYYSRGHDISNYKPMCWKCKCGNFIFNP